jgi:hypothetical protein
MGSGTGYSCPVVVFGISGIEPTDSDIIRTFVTDISHP